MAKPSLLLSLPLLLFLLPPTSIAATSTNHPKIGLCYGSVATFLPPPTTITNILQSNKISKVRLFNPDAGLLSAFKSTNIDLIIGVPNENLTSLAAGGAAGAAEWINSNVLAHVPADQVRYLAVGNEVLYKDPFYTPYLVPAINNLYRALQDLDLHDKIKLSSPQAASVLQSSDPPSAGSFDPAILPVMHEFLGFLSETGAPFMVNIYPFFAYTGDPANVPLSYTLSSSDATPVQDGPLTYTNMFDASVDAFVAAMDKEGFAGIPVAVTETGWPTSGGAGAEPDKAAVFNRKVIERALEGKGTPRRPEVPVEVFLFGMFDEDKKEGAEYEKHFGIFNQDGTTAYSISFV